MRISIDYDFQPSRTWFACLSDFKLFLSHRFSGLPLPPLFFLKYSASSLVLWQGSDCPRMDSVCVCAVGRVKLAVFFFFFIIIMEESEQNITRFGLWGGDGLHWSIYSGAEFEPRMGCGWVWWIERSESVWAINDPWGWHWMTRTLGRSVMIGVKWGSSSIGIHRSSSFCLYKEKTTTIGLI